MVRLGVPLAFCLALAACGKEAPEPAPPADGGADGGADDGAGGGTGSGGSPPVARYTGDATDDASFLFDDSELRDYELVLAPEDLAFLDAEPADEVYVEGALRFEGQEIGPVGIRYKGSVGAWVGCVAGLRSGPKVCDKLSMKVKVDWTSDEQRFYGLKKLQFHSMNNDASMMRERLGYKIFREMGVPAPRAVHARLSINGEYQGVFALVEQIDGRFTRSRFRDGEGNLYKETWPLKLGGTPRARADIEASLSTNEDGLATGDTSVERMLRFGEAVDAAPAGKVLDVVGQWMDLEHTMRYVATDRALLNDDGVFHWYTQLDGPHNFFWYEEEGADRLYLVPWDMDLSMGLMHPVTTLYTQWDETTNDCQSYTSRNSLLWERVDAACDPILGSLTALQAEFRTHTATLLDGVFSESAVHADLDRWSAQIAPSVGEAAALCPGAPSLRAMQGGVEALKTNLAEMRRRMRVRLGRPE